MKVMAVRMAALLVLLFAFPASSALAIEMNASASRASVGIDEAATGSIASADQPATPKRSDANLAEPSLEAMIG